MRRRYVYLLTLGILAGVLAVDAFFLLRPAGLRSGLDRLLRANVRTRIEYDAIDHAGIGSVEVSGVRVFRTRTSDEVVFRCRRLRVSLDPVALIRGEVEAEKIELLRPMVHVNWTDDGRIDLPTFLASSDTKSRGVTIPDVIIEDMAIVARNAPFLDASREHLLDGIDVRLRPRRTRRYRYRFDGRIDDRILGTFTFEGEFGASTLRGQVRRDDFVIEPKLVALLEPSLRSRFESIEMDGGFDLEFDLSSPDYLDTVEVEARATARNVDIAAGDWPHPVRGLAGTFVYRNGRLTTQDVGFEIAGAAVEVRRAWVDLSGSVPCRVVGTMKGLHLNETFARSLDRYPKPLPSCRGVLEAFSANGDIDIDFAVEHRAPFERVDIDLLATFQGIELAYVGFTDDDGVRRGGYPYPLQDMVGSVRIRNDGLDIQGLHSRRRSPNIRANGRVDYGDAGLGFDVRADVASLVLDDRLAAALPPSDRTIYDDFEPSGTTDFALHLERPRSPPDDPAETDFEIRLDLRGARVRPEIFPWALEELEGRVTLARGTPARIDDVRGRRGTARVRVDGHVDVGSRSCDRLRVRHRSRRRRDR